MNILLNYSAGRKSTGSPITPDCSQTAGNESAQQSLESEENRDETEEGVVDLDPEEENEDEEKDAYFDPWAAGEDPNARGAVEQWRIVAVGHRPKDFSSLRVALVGSSRGFLRKRLGLLENDAAYSAGIQGALSWQPTFLLDDEMWFPYVQEIQNRRLYRPFGSWSVSMTAAAEYARKSIDRKFQRVQAERHARKRQQAGNRQRSHEVEKRRADLLNVAPELWSQVVMEEPSRPGRPGHRKRLAELLTAQGMVFSHRDLRWLMQMLAQQTDRP